MSDIGSCESQRLNLLAATVLTSPGTSKPYQRLMQIALFYRARLLSAYAQGRRPSTSTLATEKKALANEISSMSTTASISDEYSATPRQFENSGALRAVVAEVVESALLRVARGTAQGDLAQNIFLRIEITGS